jgi:hypothetical protein
MSAARNVTDGPGTGCARSVPTPRVSAIAATTRFRTKEPMIQNETAIDNLVSSG